MVEPLERSARPLRTTAPPRDTLLALDPWLVAFFAIAGAFALAGDPIFDRLEQVSTWPGPALRAGLASGSVLLVLLFLLGTWVLPGRRYRIWKTAVVLLLLSGQVLVPTLARVVVQQTTPAQVDAENRIGIAELQARGWLDGVDPYRAWSDAPEGIGPPAPLPILVSVPLIWASEWLELVLDGRLLSLIVLVLGMLFCGGLFEAHGPRELATTVLALAPVWSHSVVVGDDRVWALVALLGAAAAALDRRPILAATGAALAVASHVEAWFFLPFLLVWMVRRSLRRGRLAVAMGVFAFLVMAAYLPFLLESGLGLVRALASPWMASGLAEAGGSGSALMLAWSSLAGALGDASGASSILGRGGGWLVLAVIVLLGVPLLWGFWRQASVARLFLSGFLLTMVAAFFGPGLSSGTWGFSLVVLALGSFAAAEPPRLGTGAIADH